MGMENRLEISHRNENTKIQKDEVNSQVHTAREQQSCDSTSTCFLMNYVLNPIWWSALCLLVGIIGI